MRKTIALLLLLFGTPACGAVGNLFGGPRVDALATSVQKPANVAVYLAVSDGDEPVTDLEAQNFAVYENDQLLARDQIDLQLLPRAPYTNERIVLLVDLSGKPSSEQRAAYAKAVENFLSHVQSEISVTVLAYDGSPGLKFAGDFPRDTARAEPTASLLRQLEGGDASRDLNGALINGLKDLDIRLHAQKKPVYVGTLVLFARGADLAGRVTDEQVQQALENSSYNVIGVGIGEQTPYLDSIARSGVVHAQSDDTVPIAFEDAASRALKTHRKYYALAYCSPGRAGTRSLRVEVEYRKDESEKRASFATEFDAKGFGPGCKADTPPRFVVPRPENEAAPQAATSSASAPADPSEATAGQPAPAKDGEVAPPPDKPEYK